MLTTLINKLSGTELTGFASFNYQNIMKFKFKAAPIQAQELVGTSIALNPNNFPSGNTVTIMVNASYPFS
jgi:hypothetical protein